MGIRHCSLPLSRGQASVTQGKVPAPLSAGVIARMYAPLANESLEPTGRPAAPVQPGLRPGRPAAHFRRYTAVRTAAGKERRSRGLSR